MNFRDLVRSALAAKAIPSRLQSDDAIVLERIARGGGDSRWFYCRDEVGLHAIESVLSPGSVVSFYFDNRIKESLPTIDAIAEIEATIRQSGDAVVGTLGPDGVEIHCQSIAGRAELQELLDQLPSQKTIYHGAFPARDDDGQSSITLTLPDLDGETRAHPH